MIPRIWLLGILGAAIVGVVVVAYGLGRKHEANEQAAELLQAKQRAETAESELRRKTLEIDTDDQIQARALDERFVLQLSQPRPIRMCEPASERQPENSAAASGRDAASDGRHVLSAGPDLGPAFLVYGRDCERIRQQLTTLQEWAAMVTAAERR